MKIDTPIIFNSPAPSDQKARQGEKDSCPESSAYSFLLIEDHPMFVQGFSSVIQQIFPTAKLQVVTCGLDALQLFKKFTFDLVFLDLNLPDISGYELLGIVQKEHFSQPVVVFSGVVAPSVLEKVKRLGALGAFSKRVDKKHLKTNCLMLLEGIPVFESDSLLSSIVNGEAYQPTERELDVLIHLADGLDNSEICEKLCISDSTIRTHLRKLFFKLNVTNRTACLVEATRHGWI
tara:strand:- start:3331 stop:4032 length:702 start_codon:yes stop_codon:yes gene_type:complete